MTSTRPRPRVLFVSDSTTLSGAEVVMLGHVDDVTRTGGCAHVFLSAANPRLVSALAARGVEVTTTRHYSRTPLRTTLNPLELARFGIALSRVARELSTTIRRERIDLVHAVSYPASLYAALACRSTGRRQIWHEHNIKRLHPVNRAIYRLVARTCHRVIGPSDAVRDNLRRAIVEEKVETLYNGIDLSRFVIDDARAAAVRRDLGLDPDTPAVGLFGQMLPYKGHGTLLDAAPAVLTGHPQARFFFVGALENPPYQEELRARIDRAGLGDRITFTGWRPDVPDVMRAMDVVVVATTTPEPAALSLMEAMAMGRPLVASRTGGTPEIVVDGETGYVVPPGDGAATAAAVSALLADPARAAAFGQAGRARVEARFALERHLTAIRSLYATAPSPCPSD